MAAPATREQFKEHCLRELGKPVIDINVDNTQVDDRVDEALAFYADYHYDGTQLTYLQHQVTAADITNRYITLDETITGVNRIFPIGDVNSSSNMFSLTYQMSLNDVWGLRSAGRMTDYYLAQQHISLMQEMLVGQTPIRFNRHMDRVHIDMDWSKVTEGKYIVIEAYEKLDPNVYTDVWADRWLLRYAAQLIKKQWGTNLKKFQGIQLPGGVSFSGDQIYAEADNELIRMEEEMISSFSLPVFDLLG